MEEYDLGVGWDPGQPQNIPKAWEAYTIQQSTNTAEDMDCPYYNSNLKDQQYSESELLYCANLCSQEGDTRK